MKYHFFNLVKYLRKIILYRIFRMETFGVRVALIRCGSEILLIKHPYDNFWVLPGGGIKRGEEPKEAAMRELEEETGFVIQYSKLLGKYQNSSGGKNDNVFLFTSNDFKKSEKNKDLINKIEVQKQEWFSFQDLPAISPATRRRILEILNKESGITDRQW